MRAGIGAATLLAGLAIGFAAGGEPSAAVEAAPDAGSGVVAAWVKVTSGTADAGTHTHKWAQVNPSVCFGPAYSAVICEKCARCGAYRKTQWGRDAAGTVVRPKGGPP